MAKRAMEYSPEKPLYVVAIGAITNIASAILINPKIVENIVVVWLGGHALHYSNTREFNMFQDVAAARVVFTSGAPIVQLPCMGVVSSFTISTVEMEYYLKGKNPVCDYLCETVKDDIINLTDYEYAEGEEKPWKKCVSRVIWDVTAIGWLLNDDNKLMESRLEHCPIPEYDDRYFEEGYPPDNIGVCADVIWRAFKEAGYSLRDMIDKDIAARRSAYPNIKTPDSNIDFRRVVNLKVFFEKYAVSLTTDIDATDEWQPGDIVVFGNNTHIGIVSDKRNSAGRPYIIHNGGQKNREEDYLGREYASFHYRFDASKVDESVLCPWKN